MGGLRYLQIWRHEHKTNNKNSKLVRSLTNVIVGSENLLFNYTY